MSELTDADRRRVAELLGREPGGAYEIVVRNELGDPFGAGTAVMPWDDGSNSVENAVARVDVFFEFLEKIQRFYHFFGPVDQTWPKSRNLESHPIFHQVHRQT